MERWLALLALLFFFVGMTNTCTVLAKLANRGCFFNLDGCCVVSVVLLFGFGSSGAGMYLVRIDINVDWLTSN